MDEWKWQREEWEGRVEGEEWRRGIGRSEETATTRTRTHALGLFFVVFYFTGHIDDLNVIIYSD